jgi:NADH:ubiquinone oxidoreductase subunit 4 (subunit M)
MATVLGVALVATLVLGVYPRPLFEFAEASARTLGVAQLLQVVR